MVTDERLKLKEIIKMGFNQYQNIALILILGIMTSCINKPCHENGDVTRAYKMHSLIIKAHQKSQLFSVADFFNSYFFLQSLTGTGGTLDYHTYFQDINYRTFETDLKTWNKIIKNNLCFYNLLAQKKNEAERYMTIVFQQGFFNNDTVSLYLNRVPVFENIVFSNMPDQENNRIFNLHRRDSLLIMDQYWVNKFVLQPASTNTNIILDINGSLDKPVDIEVRYRGKSFTYQAFPNLKKIYWINSNLNSEVENLLFPTLKRNVFFN